MPRQSGLDVGYVFTNKHPLNVHRDSSIIVQQVNSNELHFEVDHAFENHNIFDPVVTIIIMCQVSKGQGQWGWQMLSNVCYRINK